MNDNSLILVDTNVLVYAYDRSEPEKQTKAITLLDRLIASGSGLLSAEVLAKFFVIVTRKLAAPLPIEYAITSIENYLASWTIFDTTSLSYWKQAVAYATSLQLFQCPNLGRSTPQSDSFCVQ